MSDFINNFWSVYVAAITLIGIFGCLLLLILVASKKVVPRATTPRATSGTKTCVNSTTPCPSGGWVCS
jgi:hypothetical protein